MPTTSTLLSPRHDEAELIAALRRGDEDAYARLIERHERAMLAVARRFLSDEHAARDAVQDALLAACCAMRSFRGDAHLRTWLHRITVNAALMYRRTIRGPVLEADELTPDGGEGPLHAAARAELCGIVREGIDELPAHHRNVLHLRDIEGLENGELARALGGSANAAKIRVHRARRALAEILARRWPDAIPA